MVLVFLVRRKKNEGGGNFFFLERSVSFPSEEENSGKVS